MSTEGDDIDAFMSRHFAYIPLGWLREVNESLQFFTKKNGCNVELTTRFSKGEDDWTEWKERRLNRRRK